MLGDGELDHRWIHWCSGFASKWGDRGRATKERRGGGRGRAEGGFWVRIWYNDEWWEHVGFRIGLMPF
jgi:hypothetical protein